MMDNTALKYIKFTPLLFVLTLLLILSCNDDEMGNPDPGTTNPDDMEMNPMEDDASMSGDTTSVDSEKQYLTLDSDYLFDQEKLYTYELLLSEENLEYINNDPAAEEYVSGALVFQGDTISPVGIRYKGSIGAFVGCVSGANWADPSGSKTCTKLSMKVKINYEGRQEKFYGLKKLQFHSMNNDDSQLRERVGYALFREMGVPAPRAVHARLLINGEYNGLFALIEQVDGRFAKHNWDDDDGNIYKEVWPLHMDGYPLDEQTYAAALETNEELGDVSLMREFGSALETAESESEIQQVIRTYMHLDEALAYCVVDRMIRHDDGPFHWYCDQVCTNHNYFWYEEPNNKKLHLVAWDLDNAFENILGDANPVTPIADEWGETRNNCEPFTYGFFFLRQWSASCDKLTGGWASFETEYDGIKQDFKAGPFSQAAINEKVTRWSEQIEQATLEANQLHGDAVTLNAWDRAVDRLLEEIAFQRENG